MAKKPVVWTETAVAQRRMILKFWTEKTGNSNYSEKLLEIIKERIKVIQAFPDSFIMCDFPGTRVSALGHFSIYYKVNKKEIIITAFWDNRQDPRKLIQLLQKP